MRKTNIEIISGEDEYSALQYLKSKGPLKFFDASEIRAFVNSTRQESLFGDKAIPVLVNGLGKIGTDEAKELLGATKEVVIWEKRAKISAATFDKVGLKYEVRTFNPLKGNALSRWIRQNGKEKSLKLSQKVINELIVLHGANLFFLDNEISLMHLYLDSDENNVKSVDELPRVVGAGSVEANAFDMLDSLGKRDVDGVNAYISKLPINDDDWSMFYRIVSHLRNVLRAKLGDKVSGFEFVNRKMRDQAKMWRQSELIDALRELLEIEFRVKKGESSLMPELIYWLHERVATDKATG